MSSLNTTQLGWCGIDQHDSFGPVVKGCRGSFDLTLLFEESILSVAPSAVLLLLVPARLLQLSRSRRKVRRSLLQVVKVINCIIYFALQLELLITWTRPDATRTRFSVATAAVTVVDAVVIGTLSFLNHSRSVRPSTILQLYLTLSLLFDIVRTRTLWLLSHNHLLVTVFTTATVSKALMLLFELLEKRSHLEPAYKYLPREATSGFANLSIFWWLNRLLRVGAGKIIGLQDLDDVEADFHSATLQQSLQSNWLAVEKPKKYALLLTTAKTFRWSLLAGVLPRLCVTGFTYAQPFLISRLINYVGSPDSKVNKTEGNGLVGAYMLVFFGAAIASGRYTYETLRAVTKIRGGLVTIIYSTTQDLHTTAIDESAASSLMSTDVERIVQFLQYFHNLWATPIELAIAIYLLERQLGAACIVPVILAITCSAASMLLSPWVGRSQAVWLGAIQKRLNITSSMLGSIKETKMAGLTDLLRSIIQRFRIEEISSSYPYRKLLVWSVINSDITNALGPVVTFAFFTILSRARNDQALLATQAFTSLTVLSLIGTPLLILIQTFPHMISVVGSFSRIQDFLASECRRDDRICLQDSPSNHFSRSGVFPGQAYSSKIELAQLKPTASRLNDGTAVSIVDGTFGWTSSSQTVLQDVNITVAKGSLTMIIGPVGCGKSTLVKSFLGETRTSKGFVSVSSREMSFCDQSSWLYNATARQNIIGISEFDPLWYETVINACALQKDMEDLPLGDQTILGSRGIAVSGGQKQRIAIARAVYSRKKIAIFDDVMTGLDATTEEHVFVNVFGSRGLLRKLGTTIVLVTHKARRLSSSDRIIAIGQSRTITEQGAFTQLESAGGYVSRLLSLGDQEKLANEEKILPQKEGKRREVVAASVKTVKDGKRQTGDLSVYKYFCEASGYTNVALAFGMSATSAFCAVYSTFWLQKWVQANQQNPNKDVALYLCIYALLAVTALGSLWLLCWQIMVIIIPRAGRNLHQIMLQSTLQAPLSFLSTTDVGVTMNRFSQDMQLIDTNLQSSSINSIDGLMSTIMRIIVVCITAKYFAVTVPFALFAVYFIQRYYLRTSRQLRLLDIEAKAPLYTHFLETLNGLATIRAYGWQEALQKQNHELMDAAQKPFYLLACIQRWLAFVLDILTAVLAIIVVVFAVTLRSSTTGGDTGVALVNVVSMNQVLTMLIIAWTGLETAIGAVARVRSFSQDTPSEVRPDAEEVDLKNWPSAGTISFENVSGSYSGKSSLILCLLQMLEVQSGSIKIDNVDLASTSRESVRTSLITISQDAVFIEGTVRLNMDPHSSTTDDTIIEALNKVQLWDLIEKNGGLDARSADVHLSHGQQQLFCLARALIRKGRILLLDEATSSIDSETNKVMQELIRREFREHTIISVEHTLENILDFDRIAVFDTGVLMEFDTPAELLGRASAFRALYNLGSL